MPPLLVVDSATLAGRSFDLGLLAVGGRGGEMWETVTATVLLVVGVAEMADLFSLTVL